MQLTSVERIEKRVADAKATKHIKDYMYNMRRFLAGEAVQGLNSKTTQLEEEVDLRIYKGLREWPDFRIGQHAEGVSNQTLTWVLTLIKQTLISKPRFTWPDLKPSVSEAREQFVLDRLRLSGYKQQQMMALFSYCTDGIGYWRIGIRSRIGEGDYSLPFTSARYVDTLDMYTDIHAVTPDDHRWRGANLRISEETAREEFGDVIVDKYFAAGDQNTNKESRVASERILNIIEYFDGATRAYLTGGNTKCFFRKPNNLGCIPFIAMSGPTTPSMRTPLPHIINVIGAQTAHANLQRVILEVFRGLKPFYIIDEACFTPESVKEFYEGDDCGDPVVLKWAPGTTSEQKKSAIILQHVDKVESEARLIKQDLEKEIVRALGVNPFAGGATINPEFSAEVGEIAGQSQLTAKFIQEDLSGFLGNVANSMCKIGAEYDEKELRLRDRGDVFTYGVHEGYPIKPFLYGESEVETTAGAFESDAAKVVKANEFLAVAQGVAEKYPRIFERAIEKWLQANGERDIDYLFSPLEEDSKKLEMLRGIPAEVIAQVLQSVSQGGAPIGQQLTA